MAEVAAKLAGEKSTLWQSKERDSALENEMLYMLMVFLGGDAAKAREKVINAKEDGKVYVELQDGLNGFAKLVFKLNFIDTWDNMSWAITNLNVDLEDKDLKEKTFYINTANELEKGFISSILGDDAIRKSYQIQLKSIGDKVTEVYFNDISEINDQNTKEFSYILLGNIQKQF
jgi:outer membrane protein assembly factor BamC